MSKLARSVYPERLERKESALDSHARTFAGRLWHRVRPLQTRLSSLARAATRIGPEITRLSDDAIRTQLRQLVRKHAPPGAMLIKALVE